VETAPTVFTAEERWLDGNTFGLFDGSTDGSSDGSTDGSSDGSTDGKTLGLEVSEGIWDTDGVSEGI
jgi:hypothetical protein